VPRVSNSVDTVLRPLPVLRACAGDLARTGPVRGGRPVPTGSSHL